MRFAFDVRTLLHGFGGLYLGAQSTILPPCFHRPTLSQRYPCKYACKAVVVQCMTENIVLKVVTEDVQ